MYAEDLSAIFSSKKNKENKFNVLNSKKIEYSFIRDRAKLIIYIKN